MRAQMGNDELSDRAVWPLFRRKLRAEAVRCGVGRVAKSPDSVGDALRRVREQAAVERLDGMKPELEARHDPEVGPCPTESPEQLGVLVFRGVNSGSVRGHHLGGQQVVACEPE